MGKLNIKQKILLAAAFLIFISATIVMIVLALPSINIDNVKNTILAKNITAVSKVGSESNKTEYAFGEIISNQGNSEIFFENNALITNDDYSLTIDATKNIKAGSLIAYFNFQTSVGITFNTTTLSLGAPVTGIIDSQAKAVIILSGSATVNGQSVNANTQIQEQNGAFITKTFNRNTLNTNKEYKNLITIIGNYAAIPEELANINPPEFSELNPKSSFSTRNSTISITGQVPVQTKLTINDEEILISSDNTFTKEFQLKLGANTITLVLKDKYENSTTKEITVTRNVSNKTDCTSSEIEARLICLFNNYRDDNNFDSIIVNQTLKNLTLEHSTWMSENVSTSSIESNGLSYIERCQSQNLICKTEINLELTGQETAEEIFATLILDTTNKQNILNASEIGTAITGNYLSILLI